MITESIGWCGWCEVVEDCDVYESSIELFNPDNSRQHQNVPKDVLVAYNPRIGIRHIRYFAGPYELRKDGSSVIVQIDGACRRNGTQYARGGWGVFFGPNSQYNSWSLLPPNAPHTSTFAELYSLIIALEMIRDELPLYLERVFIVSDSSYLVRAFTEYMSAWLDNWGRNARGQRVAHWNFLLEIKEIIDNLTWSGDRNMEIKFWHVPREQNAAADALANRAFN
ncbi:NAD dependent epimerase [Fusarium phyllophilum]|uniref:ribonuclease H n=1 Tax=Fusarium phyllophilum TaxID=47803 RepID=A0A8H5KBR8_9HYPO|nr:NAD dependent epimerase [Fusarium phyllophilum]